MLLGHRVLKTAYSFSCLPSVLSIREFSSLSLPSSIRTWNPFSTRQFDRKVWRSASGFERGSMRGHMAHDLLFHHLHKGQSYAEVAHLIDYPADIDSTVSADQIKVGRVYLTTLNQKDYSTKHRLLCTLLGKDYSVTRSIDHTWLYLYFDENKRYTGGTIAGP